MKKNKRSNKLSKKCGSFVFLFACIAISFLTLGFSSFSSNLAINGEAIVRSSVDVRITDYHVSSSDTSSSNSSSYTDYTVTSNNSLQWYWSTITYDVTVTNLSSNKVLVTDVSLENLNNDIFTYHLENLEINKTEIPAASTYTFQIVYEVSEGTRNLLQGSLDKLDSIFAGKDISLQSTIKFTFYKVPQYMYEISAIPDDSLVVLKSGDEVIASGTGYVSKLVEEGTNISWSVTKTGYYLQSGSDVVTSAISKHVELAYKNEYTFTVVPTPSDSVVTIRSGDEVVATGTGMQSYEALDLEEVSYSVERFEYETYTGSYTISGSDHTENVSLTELPWITGVFDSVNWEVAKTNQATVYHPGYYLIELWAGKGGNQIDVEDNAGHGGAAGYIYAVVLLEYNSSIYYTLGGNGEAGKSVHASGGANGGGDSAGLYPGAGGGYSAFAINTTSINEATINSSNVIMIAGGGGGGAANSTTVSSRKPGDGGAGGNMSSTTSAVSLGTVFHGYDGTLNDGTTATYGLGGTTVSTTLDKAGDAGGLLYGGEGSVKGGGGGAGYYGGAGGGGSGTSAKNGSGGGGGGSSFISNKAIFTGLSSTTTSKLRGTNSSSFGGSISITYLGSSY